MIKDYTMARLPIIDDALDHFLSAETYPPQIYEAMRYSLFAGGKRLRPILLMAAADAVGQDGSRFINIACGLEMIHTYSLIHDDLPAMDNDDFRRGKLTNHKVFGDGIAVLAGDGLLTEAFGVMLAQPKVEPATLIKVIREIATAAGARGMVGGQTIDLLSEGKTIDSETLKFIHQAKTGALFTAAIRAGAMLANANEECLAALTEYAKQFGLAFQITDDILDVAGVEEKLGKPLGSDVKNNKVTYVSLYSLEEAKEMAKEAVRCAIAAISDLGVEAAVLRDYVLYLLNRDS
ncbi:MAG: Farnesyl diphosphate synthase [Firmicutes bacterium]|nr:Farnesyl diphosphate synthase [Bacillota bacterium]